MPTALQVAGTVEQTLREERSRRLYYKGRFGPGANPDDPHWSEFDNDDTSALHLHRTPFGLGLHNIRKPVNLLPVRGTLATSGAEPPPIVVRPPPTPLPDERSVPPKSSPQRSGTARSAAALLEDAALPPPSNGGLPLMRQSVSARELQTSNSQDRNKTASEAAVSRLSRRSRSQVSAASLRSKIGEAVQKEVERSELQAWKEALEWKKQRERQKQIDMPLHLRTGTNPIDTGCPCNYTTAQMRSLTLPIQLATDPKWSTDIKKMNNKIGQRLEWEKKISASLSGQIMPELKFMPPKDYITNPPTPYFVPGEAHKLRSR